MLIKTNTTFRIEEYYEHKDQITVLSNIKPDFDILRDSKTLEVVPRVKTAKVVKIAPKEGDFLYVRNRAVSAGNVIDKKDGHAELIPIDEFYKFFEKYAKVMRGPNDNGDFFSHEELIKKYKTFIGKSCFVDHDNENVEKARGIILDAVYNDKGKFVELLKAVDKKAYPELARGIELGYITDTSMGCRCGHSLCSVCGNKAITEQDFCEHIANYKGSTYNGLPVFEDNRDIEFFEDSFVTTGADKFAKILEKVANAQKQKQIVIAQPNDVQNEVMKKIAFETNQRSLEGRVNALADKLKNLPWS
jgi:vacuolar-type H+-ATPase subunit E/Vma4